MGTLELAPPSGKQAEFFEARERFVAYGGARGGGKSWAVRKKSILLALRYPGIRVLVLRRTFPELRENHILPLRAELLHLATYKESEKSFSFPNGSRLKFGYCATESDVLQYQGQEYDVIFIDEATQFTEFQFQTLTACLRGANDFPKRMYLTCNPGGVGHGWVKRLFVDRDYRGSENPADYRFIAAKVYDNQVLLERDPDYVRMLENLPDDLRRAWLLGDWNVFAGQYFKMWDPEVHLLDPFPIPAGWAKYLTLDYGLDMLAAYWIAVDEEGRAYVYREVYRPGLVISEAAALIRENNFEDVRFIYAPPDLWNRRQDTGKSVADIFAEQGLYLQKADNRRVQGWYELAEWLKVRRVHPQPCSDPRRRKSRACPQASRCFSRAGNSTASADGARGVTEEVRSGSREQGDKTGGAEKQGAPAGAAAFSASKDLFHVARCAPDGVEAARRDCVHRAPPGEGSVTEEVRSDSREQPRMGYNAAGSPAENEEGERYANLRIFKTCENLARCLPLLQFDSKNPNDVANEPHEITHGPDAIRYFVAGRPGPAVTSTPDDGELRGFLDYGG